MVLTLFGLCVAAIGLILLLCGSMVAMLSFTMLATLMGGSAALNLPALGGSSIPPANLALVFLLLRAVLPGPGQMGALVPAIRANALLLIFALYGSISAWLLPRLFQGVTNVTPLRPGAVRQLFEAAPVHFTNQNVTTSVYLLGTLAAGLGSYVGASRPGAERVIVPTGIAIALIHATLGFVSAAAPGTPLQMVIDLFRNGHYAQLDQSLAGVIRMNGIWPEASGFAAYGCCWFIFMSELWLRDIRPRATGPAALLLGVALAVSTSSTAYVGLGGYMLVGCLRCILLPGSVPFAKLILLLACGFALVTFAVTLMLLAPPVYETAARILRIMTIDKTDSASGIQRAYWAKQGLDAFLASWGLGIGAGSFRSSSLIMAILGSTGVVGTLAFAGHLLRVLKPFRASTYYRPNDLATAVGSAASWTAALMLMPAAVASPSPDPGIVWAMFAGMALALRAGSEPQVVPHHPNAFVTAAT